MSSSLGFAMLTRQLFHNHHLFKTLTILLSLPYKNVFLLGVKFPLTKTEKDILSNFDHRLSLIQSNKAMPLQQEMQFSVNIYKSAWAITYNIKWGKKSFILHANKL